MTKVTILTKVINYVNSTYLRAVSAVSWFNYQRKVNKAILIKGSILDPLSHPSYSELTKAKLQMAVDSRQSKMDAINAVYDIEVEKALKA